MRADAGGHRSKHRRKQEAIETMNLAGEDADGEQQQVHACQNNGEPLLGPGRDRANDIPRIVREIPTEPSDNFDGNE